MAEMFTARQSILATFSRCALSARFELDAGERYGAELTRGTLAHRLAEEVWRTLYRQGERQMPVAEVLEVLWEILAQRDVPPEDVLVVSPAERLSLRQFAVRFASDYAWDARRFIAIEERLYLPIKCEDGVTRVLTGTPDLLIAEPPNGVQCVDLKSGFRAPATPRDAEPHEPRRYLTERGMYQLDVYGLLALTKYPRAEFVRLREIHPRSSEERSATLWRGDLEEVKRQVGVELMLLDRALQEGPDSPIWKPVPGKQCAWCIRRQACPLPATQRGAGGVQDADEAQRYALDIEAVTPLRSELIDAAKAWVDAHGPIPLPDGRVLGWQQGERSRRFVAHVPEPEPEDDTDYADLLERSLP